MQGSRDKSTKFCLFLSSCRGFRYGPTERLNGDESRAVTWPVGKKDALAIEGFDEELVGWGHEDADFVFRLSEIGITRISGAWATEVLHLWHKTGIKVRL